MLSSSYLLRVRCIDFTSTFIHLPPTSSCLQTQPASLQNHFGNLPNTASNHQLTTPCCLVPLRQAEFARLIQSSSCYLLSSPTRQEPWLVPPVGRSFYSVCPLCGFSSSSVYWWCRSQQFSNFGKDQLTLKKGDNELEVAQQRKTQGRRSTCTTCRRPANQRCADGTANLAGTDEREQRLRVPVCVTSRCMVCRKLLSVICLHLADKGNRPVCIKRIEEADSILLLPCYHVFLHSLSSAHLAVVDTRQMVHIHTTSLEALKY